VVNRLTVRGGECTTVAGAALVGHRHLRVVPLGGLPTGGVVTGHAVHTGRYVCSQLSGGGTSIVTTGAVSPAVKQAVIRLRTQPGAGGLVTTFANRLAAVDGRRRTTA
jgi:hypothetical protein